MENLNNNEQMFHTFTDLFHLVSNKLPPCLAKWAFYVSYNKITFTLFLTLFDKIAAWLKMIHNKTFCWLVILTLIFSCFLHTSHLIFHNACSSLTFVFLATNCINLWKYVLMLRKWRHICGTAVFFVDFIHNNKIYT